MGEIADDLIDRMLDDGQWYGGGGRYYRNSAPRSKDFIPAQNFNQKRKDPDPKKFDMSFFPTDSKPKTVEPEPPKPMWDDSGEPPF